MSTPLSPPDLGALSEHAPALASVVAQIASDVALVIDAEGVIRSVAEGGAALSASTAQWVGRRWVDTATPDTQRKLQLMLDEARQGGAARRREVNHPGGPGGSDIPVAWSAICLGEGGPVVAVGRDLRAVAAIQQRFLAAQQDLERDYWRRRETESRYERLFQVASDAVLVVDARNHHLLECNDAARALLGAAAQPEARPWPQALPALAGAAVRELLTTAGSSGKEAEIRVRGLAQAGACAMSVTPFRVGDRLQLLVRVRRDEADGAARLQQVSRFVETTPDAVVLTDSSGRVQLANPAFVALVDSGDEAHLRGRDLAELTGDTEGRWKGLLERARVQGVAQDEPLHLRLDSASTALRANAALLTDGEQEAVGFVLQVLSPGESAAAAPDALWPEVAQVVGRLGAAPLDTLLAEAAQAVERHLVRRAGLHSAGQVAEWAAMLGQSTEQLRSRLKRLGLDESGMAAGPARKPGTTH